MASSGMTKGGFAKDGMAKGGIAKVHTEQSASTGEGRGGGVNDGRRGYRVLGGLLGLGLSLSLAGCFSSGKPTEPREPKVVDVARVAPVTATRTVNFSGRVRASEQAALSFEVSGRIEYLELDIGDAMVAGQLLARLDKTPYRLVLERARAAEAEAGAHLEEQRLNVRRQSVLRERDMISQSRLDSAEAALEVARSRYESAQASLAIAQRDLAQTELTAPFNGSISRRLAEPSERVSPNQPVYEVISDRHGFEVETHVPENLVARLSQGREHRIRFPALDNVEVRAGVRHIASQPRTSNSYPVLLEFDTDGALNLRSGMTAQVALTLVATEAADQSAFLVPLTALRYPAKGDVQVLRLKGEQLEAVSVVVEVSRGGRARVSGALNVGDSIVARGVEFVAPGDQVAVMGEGPDRYY